MKRIYLDQNKLIDLARAHFGRKEGMQFIDILAIIKDKVAKNEIEIVFSVVHLMETSAINDLERRKRFTNFLFDTFPLKTISSYLAFEGYELLNAMLLAVKQHELPVEKYLFGSDILSIIDLSMEKVSIKTDTEELKKYIEKFIKQRVGQVDILKTFIINDVLKDYRLTQYDEWEDAAKEQEKLRKDLFSKITDDTQRFRHLISPAYEYRKKRNIDILEKYLKPEYLSEIQKAIVTDIDAFLRSIPSLYVQTKLTFQRFKDISKPIHRNDIKDIAFLSMAIPYCDIVVTENSYRHYASQENLNGEFNTIIESNINNLMNIL